MTTTITTTTTAPSNQSKNQDQDRASEKNSELELVPVELLNWDLKMGTTDSELHLTVLIDNVVHGKCVLYRSLMTEYFKKENENKLEDVLVLMMIHVPESRRRQGVATKIVTFLHDLAMQRKMHFAVGPFVTDDSEYLISICDKLTGFVRAHPFTYLKKMLKH